ncbi:MAG: ABC transporter [Chloroflexi bacterium]|nr:MAG: ABC transporter [Chloroflexota bacterium]
MAVPVAAQTRPASVRRVDTRRATLRAIYIIWYRDVLRYSRDRLRLLASLAQPLLFLLIFGTGLSSSLRGIGGGLGGAPSINYVQFIYPGIIGMAVLFTSIFSAMSIVWDREFGFLKEVLVAPIDRSAIAIGKALGGSTQAMVQGILLLVLAPIVGVSLTPLAVLELIPLIFVLAFALTTLGVVLAAGIKSIQGFQAVINFLMMPIFFLSGALFPLGNLPWWMTGLTRIDPAAYGIDPLRRVILGASGVPAAVTDRLGLTVGGQTLPLMTEVALVLAFGVVMLGIAIWSLRRPA